MSEQFTLIKSNEKNEKYNLCRFDELNVKSLRSSVTATTDKLAISTIHGLLFYNLVEIILIIQY